MLHRPPPGTGPAPIRTSGREAPGLSGVHTDGIVVADSRSRGHPRSPMDRSSRRRSDGCRCRGGGSGDVYGRRLGLRNAAVIGGFHLSGPMLGPIIEPTVAAFDDLQPAVLMPAHSTRWKAMSPPRATLPRCLRIEHGRHDDLALINEQAVGHRTSSTAGAPRYEAITLGRPESTTERACGPRVRSLSDLSRDQPISASGTTHYRRGARRRKPSGRRAVIDVLLASSSTC